MARAVADTTYGFHLVRGECGERMCSECYSVGELEALEINGLYHEVCPLCVRRLTVAAPWEQPSLFAFTT